jgi:hypothetical protein
MQGWHSKAEATRIAWSRQRMGLSPNRTVKGSSDEPSKRIGFDGTVDYIGREDLMN